MGCEGGKAAARPGAPTLFGGKPGRLLRSFAPPAPPPRPRGFGWLRRVAPSLRAFPAFAPKAPHIRAAVWAPPAAPPPSPPRGRNFSTYVLFFGSSFCTYRRTFFHVGRGGRGRLPCSLILLETTQGFSGIYVFWGGAAPAPTLCLFAVPRGRSAPFGWLRRLCFVCPPAVAAF